MHDPFDAKLLAKIKVDPFRQNETIDAFNAPMLKDPMTGRTYPNPKFHGRVHKKPVKILILPHSVIGVHHAGPKAPHHPGGFGGGAAHKGPHHFRSHDPIDRLVQLLEELANDPRVRGLTERGIRFCYWLVEEFARGVNAVGQSIAVVVQGVGGFVTDVTQTLVQKVTELRYQFQRAASLPESGSWVDIIGWALTVLVAIKLVIEIALTVAAVAAL